MKQPLRGNSEQRQVLDKFLTLDRQQRPCNLHSFVYQAGGLISRPFLLVPTWCEAFIGSIHCLSAIENNRTPSKCLVCTSSVPDLLLRQVVLSLSIGLDGGSQAT